MFQLPDDAVDFDCPWGEQWSDATVGSVATSIEQTPTVEAIPTPKLPAHSREALQAAAKARMEVAAKARQSGGRPGGCGCGRK